MAFLTAALGLLAALVTAFAATRIASTAGRRPAGAFGMCGFFVAILTYGGVLQALVMYANPNRAATALGPEAVFLLFAAGAAISALMIGAGVVAAWIALARTENPSTGRFKTTGLALLFSLSIVILAAPWLIQNQITIERSINATEAEIDAFTASYTNGLEKLTKLGALSRIEIGDEAITHYIGDPLYKVGEKGLAEYARAAMIYHTHVLGNGPMPVILRDSSTDAKVGTFGIDGVFVVHMAVIAPQASGSP